MKFTALFLICLITTNTPLVARYLIYPTAKQSKPPAVANSKLDKRIDDYQTSGRTLLATVVDLAYEYQLPTGIEYVDREATTRPLDLEFRNESLRGILASVVAQFPQYRVAFLGETVQIYSPQAREDSSNLLNKPIKDFSVVAADTQDADSELFCSLSRELKAASFCGGSIAHGQWGPLKITLHLQNARVYEILNAIVQENGQAIWVVATSHERLSKMQQGGLWHIYPLQTSFKSVVLDVLTNTSA